VQNLFLDIYLHLSSSVSFAILLFLFYSLESWSIKIPFTGRRLERNRLSLLAGGLGQCWRCSVEAPTFYPYLCDRIPLLRLNNLYLQLILPSIGTFGVLFPLFLNCSQKTCEQLGAFQPTCSHRSPDPFTLQLSPFQNDRR
jgi:hypothetical protein